MSFDGTIVEKRQDAIEKLKGLQGVDDELREEDLPKELWQEQRIALTAAGECGYALKFLDYKFKGDKNVVLAAVTDDGSALQFASPELRNDKEIVNAALRCWCGAFEFAGEDCKRSIPIVSSYLRDAEHEMEIDAGMAKHCIQTPIEGGEDGTLYKDDKQYACRLARAFGIRALLEKECVLPSLKSDNEVILVGMFAESTSCAHALKFIQPGPDESRNLAILAVSDTPHCSLRDSHLVESRFFDDRVIAVLAIANGHGDFVLRFLPENLLDDKIVSIALLCSKQTFVGYLSWVECGHALPEGSVELTNQKLSFALTRQHEFSQKRWDTFEIVELPTNAVVKVGDVYFKPVDASRYPNQSGDAGLSSTTHVSFDGDEDLAIIAAAKNLHTGKGFVSRDVAFVSALGTSSATNVPECLQEDRNFNLVMAVIGKPHMCWPREEWWSVRFVNEFKTGTTDASPRTGSKEADTRRAALASVLRDPLSLRHSMSNNDESTVYAAVVGNGMALKYAPKELQGCRDLVLVAVRTNGAALQYASKELRGDRELVLIAVTLCGMALQYASHELRGDKHIVLAAVLDDGLALQFSLLRERDEEVELCAISQNQMAFEYCDWGNKAATLLALMKASLRSEVMFIFERTTRSMDPDVTYSTLAKLTNNCYDWNEFARQSFMQVCDEYQFGVHGSDWDEFNAHMAVATYYPTFVQRCATSEEFEDFEEFVIRAINWKPEGVNLLLDALPASMVGNKAVLLAAAKRGCVLSDHLSEEVLLFAIKSEGVDGVLLNNKIDKQTIFNDRSRDFWLAAIREDEECYSHCVHPDRGDSVHAKALRSDRELALEALKREAVGYSNLPSVLSYFSTEELRNDRQLVTMAVNNKPGAFKHASDERRGDLQIAFEAVQYDKYAILHVPESQRDKVAKFIKGDIGGRIMDERRRQEDLVQELALYNVFHPGPVGQAAHNYANHVLHPASLYAVLDAQLVTEDVRAEQERRAEDVRAEQRLLGVEQVVFEEESVPRPGDMEARCRAIETVLGVAFEASMPLPARVAAIERDVALADEELQSVEEDIFEVVFPQSGDIIARCRTVERLLVMPLSALDGMPLPDRIAAIKSRFLVGPNWDWEKWNCGKKRSGKRAGKRQRCA